MTNYISETFAFSFGPGVLLDAFAGEAHCFLLESSLQDPQRGRYSFFGCDPFYVYRHKANADLDPLRQDFEKYRFRDGGEAILPAGIVGYLSYDHGLFQEQIALQSVDEYGLPDCLFGFYDCIGTMDHTAQTITIHSTGYPELDAGARLRRARQRLDQMCARLTNLNPTENKLPAVNPVPTTDATPWSCNFTRQEYECAAEKALAHIATGDIYQVNLAQRFSLRHDGDRQPQRLYHLLRHYSPSYFGGYFDGGDHQIISSSPERYLQLRGRTLLTQPMKGTRPRGINNAEDQRLRAEIINSGKEQSELLMITDLERNDLGRVCEFGSVRVLQQRSIEQYATVFQAISSIVGTVKEEHDCFDVLKACFPGGSITGCPKIRAMQLIEELEPTRRSIYTGALGYIGFNGDMDFNIMIRTILADQNNYHFQVGGGIVAESTPASEYEETLVKARAMQACLVTLRDGVFSGGKR